MDKKNFYINNEELLKEVMIYKKDGILTEELGRMLLQIANHYSTKGNFSGYTWRNDMVSDAVLTCIKYLNSFNPDKSKNAFAYITQICKNSFRAYIKSQKKYIETKNMCYQKFTEIVKSEFYISEQDAFNAILSSSNREKRKK